jgi:carbon-monoxide dehydrogenase medium subunit
MKLRLSQPKVIIDLGRIAEMAGIRQDGDALVIGAGTTHSAIEHSALVRDRCSLLAETAPRIGDVQVRHRGTIGGSLAHADPAGDWPAAVLALDAELAVRGPQGMRTIAVRDFFVDVLTTALSPDEVLTEIRIPQPNRRGAYEKARNRASGYAVVGIAVALELANGRIGSVGIGVTGAADRPGRASTAEAALLSQPVSEAAIRQAGALATRGLTCLDDVQASAAYRQHLVDVLTRRALTRALGL